jgi:hypothetical protein
MQPADDARARVVAPAVPPGGVGPGCGESKGAFALTPLERRSPSRVHRIDPPYLMAREGHWGEGDRNTIPSHLYRGGCTAVSETVALGELETVLADQPTLPWAVLLPR